MQLFADAEILKNHIEDVFHVNPASDPAQATDGEAKVLASQFRGLGA